MRRILLLAAFQVLAILAWASYHEHVWATAPTFRIPLRPRDPFDPIRGRYFVLNPRDSSIDSRSGSPADRDIERVLGSAEAFGGRVQVGFCPIDHVYRVCALAHPGETPAASARFWCPGFAQIKRKQGGWTARFDLGLRRFFIPNRLKLPGREDEEGWELEVSYRPGSSLLPRRLLFKGTPIDLR